MGDSTFKSKQFTNCQFPATETVEGNTITGNSVSVAVSITHFNSNVFLDGLESWWWWSCRGSPCARFSKVPGFEGGFVRTQIGHSRHVILTISRQPARHCVNWRYRQSVGHSWRRRGHAKCYYPWHRFKGTLQKSNALSIQPLFWVCPRLSGYGRCRENLGHSKWAISNVLRQTRGSAMVHAVEPSW